MMLAVPSNKRCLQITWNYSFVCLWNSFALILTQSISFLVLRVFRNCVLYLLIWMYILQFATENNKYHYNFVCIADWENCLTVAIHSNQLERAKNKWFFFCIQQKIYALALSKHFIFWFFFQIGAVLLFFLSAVADSASIGNSRYGPKYEYNDPKDDHHYIKFNYGSNGVYKFAFKLKDQSRHEERNEDGEVRIR